MKADFYRDQLTDLVSMVESGSGQQGDALASIPASEFTCPERLAAEKALFRRLPLIVGHSSQVAEPGDYMVHEDLGTSYLIVRGRDGTLRAFLNYCQHRGTRLVQKASGSSAQRFTCPYHAWSYDIQGRLASVPREDLFPCLDQESKGLKQVRLDERFGLLWLVQDPDGAPPLNEYLDGIEAELTAIAGENKALWFNRTRNLKANWKLPLNAFLESYHIAVLHRHSVGRFFVRHIALSEQRGQHIWSLVPRSSILELKDANWSDANLQDYVTPSYILFPNACFVLHPTSVSVLTLYPGERPGESTWNHMLLIPEMPQTDEEARHYDKTIEVLDGMTYEAEDFWVSEQMQQGLDAGAIDNLTLGLTEHMILAFHDTINRALETAGP
ncbi:MAG: aromatic ring-hydroxylating dioxygenase subunit alpha [Xanthomonadales bacterium]|nr:aromatic ring-hydroxylating dioxygenase subunit alpha [Xanthomonadales bacterium]